MSAAALETKAVCAARALSRWVSLVRISSSCAQGSWLELQGLGRRILGLGVWGLEIQRLGVSGAGITGSGFGM